MVNEGINQLIDDIISFNEKSSLSIENYERNWKKVDKFYDIVRETLKEVDRVESIYLPPEQRHYYDPKNVFLSINYDHFVHKGNPEVIHIYRDGEFSGDLYYASIKRSWLIDPSKIEKDICNTNKQKRIEKLEKEIEKKEADLFILKRELYRLIDDL